MSRRGDKPSNRLTSKRRVKIRTRSRRQAETAKRELVARPPLRELPQSLRDLEPGRALSDDQAIDALLWLQDVIDDAASAAGVE